MTRQSSLGSQKVNRNPKYDKTDIGRVTANDRYEKYGIIEVVMLDHSTPFPVWVVGDIDRKPMTGDHVHIGYVDGRKDAPYLVGHVKNKSYTTNFIEVDEKHVIIQLPVMEVGKKDGKAHNDTKKFLLEVKNKKQRAYVELIEDGIKIYHPVKKDDVDNGAYVEIKEKSMKLFHPVGLDDDGAYYDIQMDSMKMYHPVGFPHEGAYIEVDGSHTKIYNPIGMPGNGAFIDIGKALTEIYHPTGNVLVNVPNGILDVI